MTETQDRPNVSYGDEKVARDNEILRTVVGSGVHGIAIAGTDDHDEMGVFIEPARFVIGTDAPMDTFTWRTQPEGVRSGPGDTDLSMYSLRKYLRLATKGNPTALLPLWCPQESVLAMTETGRLLRAHRSAFLSKQAVERFLGYMHSQHERMLGRGKRNRVPDRPELVERYGYDVKYASHALRLAYQGHEICTMGRLTLPMAETPREHVMAVKRGRHSQESVSRSITAITEVTRRTLEHGTPLPEEPDWDTINAFSVTEHLEHWRRTEKL